MAAEVISPKQFGTNPNAPRPEAPEGPPPPQVFEDLDLSEPQYGEELLGTLTDEEAALFVDYFNANSDVMALDREANGMAIVTLGQDYRTGALHESFQKDRGYDFGKGLDPALMRDFFRAAALMGQLKANLFFGLGERFGCHDWLLGIRTKRRVYKVRCKWGVQP